MLARLFSFFLTHTQTHARTHTHKLFLYPLWKSLLNFRPSELDNFTVFSAGLLFEEECVLPVCSGQEMFQKQNGGNSTNLIE